MVVQKYQFCYPNVNKTECPESDLLIPSTSHFQLPLEMFFIFRFDRNQDNSFQIVLTYGARSTDSSVLYLYIVLFLMFKNFNKYAEDFQ